MIRKIYPLMVGALLGLGAVAAFGSAASPVPVMESAGAQADNPNIISIAKWDRERHGSRCQYRRGDCRHFYRGYYYETPWWTLPLVVGGTIGANRYYDGYEHDYYDDDDYDDAGLSNSHVEWCLNRYRSYNPRTNTWVSYSGHTRMHEPVLIRVRIDATGTQMAPVACVDRVATDTTLHFPSTWHR